MATGSPGDPPFDMPDQPGLFSSAGGWALALGLCACLLFLALQGAAGSLGVFCLVQNQPPLKEPWFLLQENGLRNKGLGARVLLATGASVIVSRPLGQQGKEKCVHTSLCILTSVNISTPASTLC